MDKALEKMRQADKLLADAEKLIKELEGLEVQSELAQFEGLVARLDKAEILLEQREDELLQFLFRCELIMGPNDFMPTNGVKYRVLKTDEVLRLAYRKAGDLIPQKILYRREFMQDVGDHLHSVFNLLCGRCLTFIETSANRNPRRFKDIKSVITQLNAALEKA